MYKLKNTNNRVGNVSENDLFELVGQKYIKTEKFSEKYNFFVRWYWPDNLYKNKIYNYSKCEQQIIFTSNAPVNSDFYSEPIHEEEKSVSDKFFNFLRQYNIIQYSHSKLLIEIKESFR